MTTLSRVASMSIDELRCRSRQRIDCWLDGIRPAFGPAGEPRRSWNGRYSRRPIVASDVTIDNTPLGRFFPGLADRSWSESFDPTERQAVIAEADRIVAGRFDLLGYRDLSFGDPVDWHLDPVAGRRAPFVHWSRIDVLDPQVAGDSKVIWELNRHQWLVTLGQAYWLSGDERYAEMGMDQLDGWVEANPYPFGINWASSLEVSFRMISWLWALFLLRDSVALSKDRVARWLTLVQAHALYVERYLSHYYSPNTHLTGEALGLFYAGVVLADCAEAARWRDLGRRILVEQLGRQVSDDGLHFEQATCYQRYTADFYLHFLALARHNRISLPADLPGRVAGIVGAMLALARPDGTSYNIGDADGGWLLPLRRRAPLDGRGTYGLAAAIFRDPEFAWAAGEQAPEVDWYFGRAGRDAVAGIQRRPPATRSTLLAPGGYAVMRTGWQADANQMVVDVGPLGCTTSGAHGHADLLSVQCDVFGDPVIVDSGTYCYTAEGVWRSHFRSTRAHNTVLVDGQPQAEVAGPFSWRERPAARLESWESTPEYDLLRAVHKRAGIGGTTLRHRRRVAFLKPDVWVIIDDIQAAGVHDAELRLQFSPRQVTPVGAEWVKVDCRGGSALWMYVTSTAPLTREIREGHCDPIDGWISTAYGMREPAPAFVANGTFYDDVRITTALVAERQAGPLPPRLAITDAQPWARTSIRIGHDARVLHLEADDSMAVEILTA